MKKSVIILIALIYIASIALVSFFGLKFKVFDEIVYVSSIELLNTDLKEANETQKTEYDYYVVIRPNAETGERRYQIQYRVHPDNATNQEVDFVYDQSIEGVSVSEDGIVSFENPGSVIVSVVAKDGGGEEATVRLAIISR